MAVFEFFDGLNAGRRQFSQRLLGLWSAVSWGEGLCELGIRCIIALIAEGYGVLTRVG